MTYGAALDRIVRMYPDRELLIFYRDGQSRRYRSCEFLDEVNQLARGLLKLGVQPGDKVALWLANLPECAVAEFAIAKLGAVMVAINTRYKVRELEYVLRQSDATTLIIMDRFLDTDYEAMVRLICPELNTCRPGQLESKALPRLKQVITLGDETPGMLTYRDLLALGDDPALVEALQRREASVDPDDVVLIQYTSGTTAFPKGAMLGHDQTLRNAYIMARRTGLDENDRVLSAMPMFHVGGSVCALLGTITCGCPLYTTATFDASLTLRVIEEERITCYIGIESMFYMLREHEDFHRRDRSSLSKGWTTGSVEMLKMVADEIGIEHVVSLYGLSEASPNVSIGDWRDPREKRLTTMGRPQPGVEVKIIDPATGEPQPVGQPGEICVQGYNVMKGYYKMPEETTQAIDPEGWLHTGDRGVLDADGYLIWLGRIKDTLRVGGENVSALEVEDFLFGHPKVAAAAVVGIPDERLGEVPMAFIKLKPGMTATPEEIIAYCRNRIANFKVPRYIRFVKEFPMTGSGKIQKFVLREQAMAEMKQLGLI